MKTGKIVTGSVLDCNKKHLERALKDYEPRLYLKWNPAKCSGIGCWELRIRPLTKTAVPKWELGNSIVFDMQYVETFDVNHVKDFALLNYNILNWVQDHDAFKHKDWVSALEDAEEKSYNKELDTAKSDLKYALKHHKGAMGDLKEYARSGNNLANLFVGEW